MKTDGIYRYREDAPPKHVERWWLSLGPAGTNWREELGWFVIIGIVVFAQQEFHDRGMAAWLLTPIVAAVLVLLFAWMRGEVHRRLFITIPLMMVFLAGLTRLL